MAEGLVLGVDVGGTFTDLVVVDRDTNDLRVVKYPSNRARPQQSVLDVIRSGQVDVGDVRRFAHGTTISTNTVIERDGANVGLLTTQGFEDVLEIQHIDREHLYDLRWDKPTPLVPRHRRIGVDERVRSDGTVLRELSEASVRSAVARLRELNVDAIAVCLLFSFVNPEHEQRVRDLIREEWPEVDVSLSSDLSNESREYDRASTVTIDAYVKPRVGRYITELSEAMNGLGLHCGLSVMKSSGGVMTAQDCAEHPINTLLSGPAGGAIAGRHFAALAGWENAITLDMGGTSADAALVHRGETVFTTDQEIEWGIPVKIPMVDVRTIGAGGGSIAWIDQGDRLKVGPQSAGADPGPACYGNGGTDATVTDANVVLGYLNPAYFVGGSMKLDATLAEHVVAERVSGPTGLSLPRAARGIVDIANVNMMHLLRRISVQEGHDPRDFALVAFGGSGPVHACDLARQLGVRAIVVPPVPGALSAYGLLLAKPRYDFVQSLLRPLSSVEPEALVKVLRALQARGVSLLDRAGHRGGREIVYAVDLRYQRQNYHVLTDVDVDAVERQQSLVPLREEFARQYHRLYGYTMEDEPIEIVNCRVSVIAEGQQLRDVGPAGGGGSLEAASKGDRPAWFAGWRDYRPCPVFERARLPLNVGLPSPCIVEQPDTTIVVPPGDRARVDGHGIILIEVGRDAG